MIFDEASVALIAEELGFAFAPEPYRVRGAAVYAGTIPAGDDGPVRVVLWPSIGRVDAYRGLTALVLKDVDRVDIYPGVEVTFRRRGGGYLFVTRQGRVHLAV